MTSDRSKHFTIFFFIFTLFIIILHVPRSEATNGSSFTVGTVLFSSIDVQKECWTQENVALLTTRMLMANLMPHTDKIKAEDDSFIADIIEYFRLLLEVIRANTTGKTKHIMLLAATDTMGGYMKHLVVPISKYSYYAGNIQYASIIRLYQLYDELKTFLRTNGDGWAKPWKNAGRHIQAKAISVQSPSPTSDPCKGLIYYRHQPTVSPLRKTQTSEVKSCGMDVPLPFFDSKTHPAAIAVPFRTFGLRNLESRVSAYILVKYFVAVSKCMAARNTNDEDVHRFDANIFSFIVSKVMPHLGDEKFYAAFGGVLRILQTVTETTKARGHAIGNINIMPETAEREPPDIQDDEDVALSNNNAKKTKSNDNRSRNNLILLAALATIVVWFCLGAAFVCCRIKSGKMQDGNTVRSDEACQESTCPGLYEPSSPSGTDVEAPETHTKVLYSVKHKLNKDKHHKEPKSSSKKSIKSTKSSKSTKSRSRTHTTELDDSETHSIGGTSTDQYPVVLEARQPVVSRTSSRDVDSSEARMREQQDLEDEKAKQAENRRGLLEELEKARRSSKVAPPIEYDREEERRIRDSLTKAIENENKLRDARLTAESRQSENRQENVRQSNKVTESRLSDNRDSSGSNKAPQIQVHSVQYYPPTFACHTSMTGKVKLDMSSTEDVTTSRDDQKRPYVFGYDFQTTSEETTPRDQTDGETEMGGNMSK